MGSSVIEQGEIGIGEIVRYSGLVDDDRISDEGKVVLGASIGG